MVPPFHGKMSSQPCQAKTGGNESPIKFLRRFSSIKVNFEKEKRKTISKYQQHGLRVSICVPKFFQDKKDVRARIRQSVERYSIPELYVKMICALFPGLKAREMPDSNALIKHLKQVFRLSDSEHSQLLEIARITKLPQRIINLEIVEARNIPAKDANGLSDPFCVVFVNSRDVAQRTKVVYNSLNPVWRQYFTFKVNDPNRDVLYLEVMDYNEGDEPLRDRIRKFKEIKSPSNFGVLLKEIANARSVQELIGTVRIPVNEISSETIEKWFKLKNHEDRGEIYLRMALGYNKSKEAATEEFLQIIHFFVVYEIDRDSALETPFHWDEQYEMWSKYVLRQFKWQGGLKPKDIVLAKWRVYTTVNSIFPLNANMMCLLMNAVLERILAREYDAREVLRFWEGTTKLVTTINSFLTDIHEILPYHVTVLHTYHMLKTLDLLNQFLTTPDVKNRCEPPFNKAGIVDGVTKAIRDGANKFYLQVFSDCTSHDNENVSDPLLVAMESLSKMGQILHEDLRLGITTVHTDFQGVLNIDYLTITFAVYDEQYGKMVKHIVEEYNASLCDKTNGECENDDEHLDEDSPAVKIGLAVFKLYLAVKTLADLAPANFKNESQSEFSLRSGFHSWFFHSVATWIDILRKRIMKWVKNSVSLSDKAKSSNGEDSKLSRMDVTDSKEIPLSPSAIDTAQMFLEIHKFWVSLGWEDPQQSYIIARKILEELYDYLIYYATQLQNTLSSSGTSEDGSVSVTQTEDMTEFLYKACVAINNINYVKEQVELLSEQLNVQDIIMKMKGLDLNEDFEGKIATMKDDMLKHVERVVQKIMKCCAQAVSPEYRKLISALSSPGLVKSAIVYQPILDFLDNCLIIMNDNLDLESFRGVLVEFWSECIQGANQRLLHGLESGKPTDYFRILHGLVMHLNDLFWPREVERRNSVSSFEKYNNLLTRLSLLELPLEDLKAKYYEGRYEKQTNTIMSEAKHGSLTVRTGYIEKESCLLLELLNARNLKSYDSNNLSDPYAVVTLVPKEYFPNAPKFTTKVHKETLFPLFEETFKITLTSKEMSQNGFVMITLYDYDFLGRDPEMGVVLIPFSSISKIGKPDVIETLSQMHLVLTKPVEEDLEFLQRFEERSWDKDAIRFAKMEKEKMEKP